MTDPIILMGKNEGSETREQKDTVRLPTRIHGRGQEEDKESNLVLSFLKDKFRCLAALYETFFISEIPTVLVGSSPMDVEVDA